MIEKGHFELALNNLETAYTEMTVINHAEAPRVQTWIRSLRDKIAEPVNLIGNAE